MRRPIQPRRRITRQYRSIESLEFQEKEVSCSAVVRSMTDLRRREPVEFELENGSFFVWWLPEGSDAERGVIGKLNVCLPDAELILPEKVDAGAGGRIILNDKREFSVRCTYAGETRERGMSVHKYVIDAAA